jgi:hypothetical protein
MLILKKIHKLFKKKINPQKTALFILNIGLFYVAVNYQSPVYYFSFFISSIILLIHLLPTLFHSKTIIFHSKIKKSKEFKKEIKKHNKYIVPSLLCKQNLLLYIFFICSLSFVIIRYFLGAKASDHFILNYSLSLIHKGNATYILVIFLIPLFFNFFFQTLVQGKIKKAFKKTVALFPTYSIILLISSYTAPLVVYLLLLIQINNFLNLAVMNPSKAGLIVGNGQIINALNKYNKLPKLNVIKPIVNVDFFTNLNKKEIPENRLVWEIINLIPQEFSFNKNKLPSMFLYNNELYLTELNRSEIEDISPLLTKLIIKGYINKRYIKDEPNISIIGRQEYLKYREEEINKDLLEIDEQIKYTDYIIQEAYNNQQITEQNINLAKTSIEESISKRDYYYNYCLNAGYHSYITGRFYYYYSKEECDSKLVEWNNYIAQTENDLRSFQSNLVFYQEIINEYRNYKEDWLFVRELVESQKSHTSYELGVFIPERTIKIALDSISPDNIEQYLSTLAHEYFHYASYVSQERKLLPFFEEGLTEYFARKSIRKSLGVNINIGYPIITKIIVEMSKKVGEKELENIYFTKDNDRLEYILDKTYGNGFYDESEYYFIALYYIQSTESLKYANNIMFKIGGQEITENSIN